MLPANSRHNQESTLSLESIKPGLAFIVIIFGALIAFEIFNYSTTQHALSDMLGQITFMSLPWSTILALAFCGIDFAGIARLFTPEQGMDEPKEVWYLFGAWLLAATMNAILTWWGVSIAITSHPVQSSAVVDPATLTQVVPVFVAIMVWIIRILIIGSLSLALDRILHPGAEQHSAIQTVFGSRPDQAQSRRPVQQPMHIPQNLGSASIPQRPAASRAAAPVNNNRPAHFSAPVDDADGIFDPSPRNNTAEPTYHSLNASPRPQVNRSNGSMSNDRFR